MLLRILVALLPPLLLAACTPGTLSNGPSATHLQSESLPRPVGTIPAPIQQSPSLPRPRPPVKTETYSVVVNNVNVHDLLFALARDARLNVDIHPGLTGSVTLNAIDQTLPQLLTRIAKQVDMRFELDGPNLAVMPDTPYLKNYTVDYFNISRDVTGTVSTNTQIATSTASGTGGGSSTNTSRIQIENKSKNRFWESLEKNLKELLHETDKIFPEGSTETVTEQAAAQSTTGTGAPAPKTIAARGSQILASIAGSPNPATLQNSGATVVKRMTFREAASVIANPEGGVITVRATSRQHEKVQEFLDRVMNSARRQVLIEATIIEVELSDGYQQGIEWGRLSSATNGQIKAPSLAANVSTSSVSPYVVKYDSQLGALGILATVELLRSFGTVKVLSSPKLTVLNNQTATIKVAEDFVYFSVKQDSATAAVTAGGST
ncbi:MAG TPA: type II and III secretion system protein, partial [Accumulibacter sp.]|nr:type II and III secretion system protein [Accumulibacter sp.]